MFRELSYISGRMVYTRRYQVKLKKKIKILNAKIEMLF